MSQLDRELMELCSRATHLDSESHASKRRSISLDEFSTLLAFSKRMALLSIREGAAVGLREAIEAVALIDMARVDFRDIPAALAVLAYAHARIGLSHRTAFEEASRRADPRVGEMLQEFAGQSFDGERLSNLSGLEEVSTKYGPAFVVSYLGHYSPTVDLVSVAVEIAELVEADKYGPVAINVRTLLPPVWLRSAGEASVKAALNGATGGVSVTGLLRSDERPREEYHRLLVFLLECADETRAAALESIARTAKHDSHVVHGCAEGRLFCLVIGHSVMHGIKPFETAATLARFAPGISNAMRSAPLR